ncbi:MAG TPA: D-lysine 5,6-aminomutase subunit alpha, partial [Desulfobacterales bacterium]|nr:D-lysine 5,6-aminomutase subunit alpha [Desulfobacterales bacterium]
MAQILLSPKQIDRLKRLAEEIADQVQKFTLNHSSVSVERTVLRLYGVDGVDSDNIPLPNGLVEILWEKGRLKSGVSRCFAAAMLASGEDAQTTAELIEQGKIDLGDLNKFPLADIREKEEQLA